MIKDLSRQSLAGLRLLLVLTVLLGVIFPASVWLVSLAFGDRAAGQPVRAGGRVVGSALLGQQFDGEQWFQTRPAANDYDALASGPSHQGPSNPELLAAIDERRAQVAQREQVPAADVPPDAVTASGSGLDPQISPQYARLQTARVARVNGLDVPTVARLVREHTAGRTFGVLGAPAVTVLTLNLAVQQAAQGAH